MISMSSDDFILLCELTLNIVEGHQMDRLRLEPRPQGDVACTMLSVALYYFDIFVGK